MLATLGALGMSEGLESRVAVVETIIPFVRKELEEHRKATKEFHEASVEAREKTNEKIEHLATVLNTKIDGLSASMAARENQAIGGLFVGRKMAAILLAMAAAAGAAGGKVGAFLAKLL